MYSLGIILFEMCFPFETRMERAMILNMVSNQQNLPQSFLESHPTESKIISQLLSKNPDDRPSTTELLHSELIPQQLADEKLLESLRSITIPDTTIFSTLMQKLFSIPNDKFLEYSFSNYTALPSYSDSYLTDTITSDVKEGLVKIFQKRGARCINAPLLLPKSNSLDIPGNAACFLNEQGNVVMLPYDLTIPFANFIATSRIQTLKRYSFGNVYRKNTVNRQLRSFQMVDLDIVSVPGTPICLKEIELLYDLRQVVDFIGHKMGINLKIYINHSSIYQEILEYCGIKEDQISATCEILEQRLKKPWGYLSRQLSKKNISVESIAKLESITNIQCDLRTMSSSLFSDIKQNSGIIHGIQQLKDLSKYLSYLEIKKKGMFSFHSGIVHNFLYRDGIMFMVGTDNTLKDVEVFAAGGSYSKLVSKFMETSLAPPVVVGVSIALDRVIGRIVKYEKETKSQEEILESNIDIMVYSDYVNSLADRMKIVSQLWKENIRAEYIYPDNLKLDELLYFCQENSIKWLLIIKKIQLNQGKVFLKSTTTQKEEYIQITELPEVLKQYLSSQSSISDSSNNDSSSLLSCNIHICVGKAGDNTSNRIPPKRKLTQDINRAVKPIIEYFKTDTISVIATDLPTDIIQNICSSNPSRSLKKYKSKIDMIGDVIHQLDKDTKAVLLYGFETGSIDILLKSNFAYF